MANHTDYLKSVAIAQAVAACINAEGGIGPCGGEIAEADGNTVNINSQVCDNTYEFHADGTVDLINPSGAYGDLMDIMGYSEDEMLEEFGTEDDFASENTGMPIEKFISFETGWFSGSELEDACIAFVKAIANA